MLCVLALAVVLPSLGYEWAAAAQEQFRLLDDKDIRARVTAGTSSIAPTGRYIFDPMARY
jgi:hypothetical protein